MREDLSFICNKRLKMYSACISCKLVRGPNSGKKWIWYSMIFSWVFQTQAPRVLNFEFSLLILVYTEDVHIYSHPLNISFYSKPTLNLSIYSSLNFTDYLHGTCILVFMNSPLEGQNTSPVSTASTQLAVRRSLIFTTSLVNGSLLKRWRQQCVNIDETVRFKEKL